MHSPKNNNISYTAHGASLDLLAKKKMQKVGAWSQKKEADLETEQYNKLKVN